MTQNSTECFGVSPFCYILKNDHSLEDQNMLFSQKACTYVLACMIVHLHLYMSFSVWGDRQDICGNHPVFKVYIVSIE